MTPLPTPPEGEYLVTVTSPRGPAAYIYPANNFEELRREMLSRFGRNLIAIIWQNPENFDRI